MNLKDMNRKELEQLRGRIDKQLVRVVAAEKKDALAAAEKAVKAFGFSLDELVGSAQPKSAKAKRGPKLKAKSASVAKYANPSDKSQTWTGKGRKPQWFKDQIAAGKSPESMTI